MTAPTLDHRLVLDGAALATTASTQPAPSPPGVALAPKPAAYVDAFMAATNWSSADALLAKATA